MRFEHRAGEKLIVDYAGQSVEVIDRHTGELRCAQVFVAVLGCSNYTFAEATFTQSLSDWLGSHVGALQFFGGIPPAILPDNLKSVDRVHRYDPDLNRACAEFVEHYGVAILPARVRKPRDKAKVETGGQVAAIELHTFNHVEFVLQTRTFFNGDHAFFADLFPLHLQWSCRAMAF